MSIVLATELVNGRARSTLATVNALWLYTHVVYYTSVNRNALTASLRFIVDLQWRSQDLEVGGTEGLGGSGGLRIFCCQTMHNYVYLAKLHEPLAKHEKNVVSVAESFSSSHIGEVSGRRARSWTIFFSKHNQHMALTRRLNPLKYAYFDRLRAAIILIKGLLSKFAKLIILKKIALNKRTRGTDLP